MWYNAASKFALNLLTLSLILLIGLVPRSAMAQRDREDPTRAANVTSATSGAAHYAHLAPPPLPVNRVEGLRLSLDALQAMPDSGEVVVKFREGLAVRLRDGVLTGLGQPAAMALNSTLEGLNASVGSMRRMIDLPEETLDEMRGTGQARSGRALADMNNYYVVTVPPGSTAAQLADRLMRLPEVEFAEPAPVPAPPPSDLAASDLAATVPPPPPSTPDFTAQQGYVNAAPTGIGTRPLGNLPGIFGTGVWVADVEYSWQMDHEDLLLPASRVINVGNPAVDPFSNTDHGTAVMGQLVGLNNGFGVTGIVHDSRGYVAAANTTAGYNPAQAILASSAFLIAGDVILIEQQTVVCGLGAGNFGPSEWVQSVFDAVSTATANGRIVVAAAGNGNVDLDAAGCLNRFNRSVRDSGAIIVGAGSSTDRSKLGFSSFGSRVDVQGWGQNVTTTGYGGLFNGGGDIRRRYTSTFGGTSSASPIVAGAAVAIQGRLMNCNQPLRTSVQMRTLLRSTGSAQTGVGGQIGPLPNVPAALNLLNIPGCTSATTTTLAGPSNSSLGQSVTFTATVASGGGNPTGTVSFRRGGTQFATATLNANRQASVSTSSFPTGAHQITAVYLGANAFQSSTSAALTHTVYSPPANNLFANRINLAPPPRTVTGTNAGATSEPGQPTIASATSTNAVWWTYTATANAMLTIDTIGSSFDTTLAVFTGSAVNALTLVASNDNSGGLQSRVQFPTVAGTQYQIAVAGWNNAIGNITLNVTYVPPVNDVFASRITIPAPGTVRGTNAGSTAQAGQPPIWGNSARPAVWWTFTPAHNGTLTIDTAGSNYDTILAAFSGTTLATLVSIAENDDASGLGLQSRIEFPATAGTPYQIAVAGFGNFIGNITLNVALAPFVTTTTLSGPDNGTVGDTLTFTASVSATTGTPGGTVRFRRDGTVFASATLDGAGVASVTTSDLPEGTHRITARYIGSAGFADSVSDGLFVTISPPQMQVATGGFHSCGLDADGQVWCWGRNAAGQLGDGTTTNRLVPVTVPGMTGVIQIAVGETHSCALRDSGRVFCWGSNASGQLGNGTVGTNSSSPLRMPLTGVTQISAGSAHTCALRDSGRAFCWGANASGQLGDGTTTDSLAAVRVPLTGITQVAAGGAHSCALRDSERVFCWGSNDAGQLGDGSTTDRLAPVRVVALTGATQVATGGRHSCGLRDSGRVFCWGHNGVGQLGDDSTTGRTSPVRVAALTRVTRVAAGDRHNCALRDTEVPYCWGAGGSGQLGDGGVVNSSRPVMVSGMNRVTDVAAGGRHSCVARGTGRFFCWGNNGSGQLGDNSTTQSAVPVRVR